MSLKGNDGRCRIISSKKFGGFKMDKCPYSEAQKRTEAGNGFIILVVFVIAMLIIWSFLFKYQKPLRNIFLITGSAGSLWVIYTWINTPYYERKDKKKLFTVVSIISISLLLFGLTLLRNPIPPVLQGDTNNENTKLHWEP